jgi:hypothetical protein
MSNLLSHRAKLLLFVALSLIDLMLTLWLIESTTGRAYEANPVAAWWQMRFGAAGLVFFKAAIVVCVLGLTAVIFRLRPRIAGRIMEVGCASLLVVIVYSGILCHAAMRKSTELESTDEQLEEKALAADFERQKTFAALERKVSEDLLAGNCTLSDATDLLADSEKGRDPAFLKTLNRSVYPNGSPSELLAAYLIRNVVSSQRQWPELARSVAFQLEAQFVSLYGGPAPVTHRAFLRNAEPTGEYSGSATHLQSPQPLAAIN